MTTTKGAAESSRRSGWVGRIPLIGRKKILDTDKLLFRNYRLTKGQRLDMFIRGLIYFQLAIPIGSAVYFIVTQTRLAWSYPKQAMTLASGYLGDTWDRLPIHIENLFGAHWFGASQAAPAWWVTGRHDTRHVLIGFIATLLVGAVTVGLKRRKRASTAHMVLSVPLAFVVAVSVAAVLIAFFERVTPIMNNVGVSTGNPYVEGLVGKGTIQLTVIGIIAGLAAKLVLKRTFDTIQLMSIERNIAQGAIQRWWWKIVYTPAYINRFEYLVASGSKGKLRSDWLGKLLAFGAPVVLFLLSFGVWLLYFGPAAHAGH